MEQQKLPNATLIIVFGIISIVTCCCYGVVGLIFGIIAIVLAKKATETYLANPELYTGYQNVKTGKILAIIGVVLNAIYLCWVIYIFATGGTEAMQNMQKEIMEQYGLEN
ncbi:CCC motif membrane protein [Rasiella sp. SM2506]|uniref:CCC motif membrane protein n=1 Tax=Rasiella sp. SM2506 TaxID=3423914 RepID=UPI003D797C53